MTAPSDSVEDVVERAATGARLLTVRGAGMRLVSVASNLLLIVLVTPADLGLLAVVRGIAALAGDSSDLGFAWALLRRPEPPTPEAYRSLGGIQLLLVSVFVGVALAIPGLFSFLGPAAAVPRWGVGAVLLTLLTLPLGTGGRIRVERDMDYRRIAFLDVSSVLFQNLILLAGALTHHFAAGVFVATGTAILYTNLLLWWWAPGPLPGFSLRGWRLLAGEFAGFSLGHLGSMLNASVTPILIANLFGLSIAGLWSFATRLGNVLQLAFEGFRRAAIPAAAFLARSPEALRQLAQQSAIGAARLTCPAAALAVAALPVLGWLLPQWLPAVVLAQGYAVVFAIAGVIGASLVPVAVAERGASVVLAEQWAPLIVGWIGFGVLALAHATALVWVAIPMFVAEVIAVWFVTPATLRLRWNATLTTTVAAPAAALAATAATLALRLHPLVIAATAAVVFLGAHTARRVWLMPALMPDTSRGG
ncbi:MAG TPA: hypothetical protein VHW65_03625 [Gemmatimonadales bacterium]|jgi:O-antigen/teichoic acid export membrane protein|nr:hypothetical protein [Gemmatimonadales bacterium]